jgi:hypothetical protein
MMQVVGNWQDRPPNVPPWAQPPPFEQVVVVPEMGTWMVGVMLIMFCVAMWMRRK